MLRAVLCALVVTASGFFIGQNAYANDAKEPVFLTVTGTIAEPNRGAVDPFVDKLFNYMEVEFNDAYVFTLDDLRALPQRSIRVRYDDWPREVEAVGPSIVDVIAAAGASGSTVAVQAIDGYIFEFSMEDIARDKMILALSVDGEPLSIGGRGPIWLLGPKDSFAGQEGEEGFVFAVVRIDAR